MNPLFLKYRSLNACPGRQIPLKILAAKAMVFYNLTLLTTKMTTKDYSFWERFDGDSQSYEKEQNKLEEISNFRGKRKKSINEQYRQANY